MLTLGGFKEHVLALAFAPDGRTLAASGTGRVVRVWDSVAGGPAASPWNAPARDNTRLAFAPTGLALAISGYAGVVWLWDPVERRERTLRWGHRHETCRALAYTPDGAALLVAWDDRIMTRRPDGTPPWAEWYLRDGVSCAELAPDGRTIAVATAEWTVLLIDRARAPHRAVLDPHGPSTRGVTACTLPAAFRRPMHGEFLPDAVTSLAFAPGGRRVFGLCHRTVVCWEVEGGRVLGAFEATPRGGYRLAVAPVGALLAIAEYDGGVRVLDSDGMQVAEYHPGVPQLIPIAFAPDGMRLAAGGLGQVVIWDVDL